MVRESEALRLAASSTLIVHKVLKEEATEQGGRGGGSEAYTLHTGNWH